MGPKPTPSKPAAANFLTTAMRMIDEQTGGEAIQWSLDGLSFIVLNPDKFLRVLPQYFKTRNYSSFVRQLNMYDFHKVKNPRGLHEFKHGFFQRGRPELLPQIKRKIHDGTGEREETEDLRLLALEKSRVEVALSDLQDMTRTLAAQNSTLNSSIADMRKKSEEFRIDSEQSLSKNMYFFFQIMQKFTPEMFEQAKKLYSSGELALKINNSTHNYVNLLKSIRSTIPEFENDVEQLFQTSPKGFRENLSPQHFLFKSDHPLMIRNVEEREEKKDLMPLRLDSPMMSPLHSLHRFDNIDGMSFKSDHDSKSQLSKF